MVVAERSTGSFQALDDDPLADTTAATRPAD
jgi:hypothetical protein